MIGKTLAKRYKIEERIGDGGMAIVYKGHDAVLNRWVTIKILRAQFVLDEDFVHRFRREAQAAASLSHPNVVNIYDVGEEDDTYYIVMEYIDGKTLKELINEKERLPVEEAVEITRQICEALVHAHKNKIIHRDIKPQNILITKDKRVKVTDFGIARAVTTATMTYNNNEFMGSVHYSAPEQAKGGLAEEKADLYSLGIVFYEMLTGKVPFSGESPISIAIKHLQEDIKSPVELNPEVTSELERIVLRAVQKDLNHRYQSAEEMLEELKAFINNEIINNENHKQPIVNSIKNNSIPVKRNDNARNNEGKKGKKRAGDLSWRYSWIVVGFLIFFIFVAALAMGFNHLKSSLLVPETEVPDIVNLSIREATGLLNEAGLEGDIIEEVSHDEVPTGYIVSQFPEAGRIVKEGREIELIISTGPTYIEVPLVTGKREQEAKIVLEDKDLVVEVSNDYSSDVEAGKVISQDPGQGSKLSSGEIVSIVVSKGSEPFTLSDFSGHSLEDAKEWVRLYNLELRDVDEEHSEDVSEGHVIKQSPKAGEMVQALDPIDLVVSKGPDPEKAVEAYDITIDPSLWGIDHGETVRIDVDDNKGKRTAFESSYTGSNIVIEGWGTGTVSIMKKEGQGYITLEYVNFPQ